uniref:Receptor-transporting protein 3-like n=1 Tax=Geotrypetes seraphini TaxID=260995 RepID=A0A6P8S722_GEOSA|nr:receptor-transporting protein 3-like [Geotrypetes seraphini]
MASSIDLHVWNNIFQGKLRERNKADVWTLSLDENVQPGPGWKRYSVQLFGRFRCSSCSRTWASAKVQILFHMKLEMGPVRHGWVMMRVFKQECGKCSAATLEEPEFVSENIEIALERLVNRIQEKFYRDFSGKNTTSAFIRSGKQDGPHESAHCEACRLGLCDLKLQDEERRAQASTSEEAEKSGRVQKTKMYVNQLLKPLSSVYNISKIGNRQQTAPASLGNSGQDTNQSQKPLSSVYDTRRTGGILKTVPRSASESPGSVIQKQRASGSQVRGVSPVQRQAYTFCGSEDEEESHQLFEESSRYDIWEDQFRTESHRRNRRLRERYGEPQPEECCPCTLL